MPTYEYRCPEGHEFERFFRKISDAQVEVTCPICGKPAERRMSAGAGLVFKGSGFYLTDYGRNAHRKGGDGGGSKGGAKSEASSESSGGGDSKSSDAKPDAKSESSAPKAEPKAADGKPAASAPTKSSSSDN